MYISSALLMMVMMMGNIYKGKRVYVYKFCGDVWWWEYWALKYLFKSQQSVYFCLLG